MPPLSTVTVRSIPWATLFSSAISAFAPLCGLNWILKFLEWRLFAGKEGEAHMGKYTPDNELIPLESISESIDIKEVSH